VIVPEYDSVLGNFLEYLSITQSWTARGQCPQDKSDSSTRVSNPSVLDVPEMRMKEVAEAPDPLQAIAPRPQLPASVSRHQLLLPDPKKEYKLVPVASKTISTERLPPPRPPKGFSGDSLAGASLLRRLMCRATTPFPASGEDRVV